jgi:hypothetical protein
LKEALNADPNFIKFKNTRRAGLQKIIDNIPYIVCLLLICLGVYLSAFSSDKRIAFFADKITTGALAVVIVQMFTDLRRKN